MSSCELPVPELSVLVPTYGRSDTIRRLLDHLGRQTLAPERFEVVVVDDGSPLPLAMDRRYPLRVTLLRQENAGPGAARNLGAQHCRAPWTLILNDDALPAPDLLERHLARARTLPPQSALLGTFDFTPAALQSPFTQVLQHSDLLFDFPNLRDGQRHPWTFFWTCNLGVPTAVLLAQKFDAARFREALVEDVELGYRLQAQGWAVVFDRSLVCHHDHTQQPAGYFRRMVRLGVNMARMAEKHQDYRLLAHFEKAQDRALYQAALRYHVEAFRALFEESLAALERLERNSRGRLLEAQEIAKIAKVVRQMGTVCYFRGIQLEWEGVDPYATRQQKSDACELTSVVLLSHDQLAITQRCIQALRATREALHPIELIVVDDGSRDGSAEWLAAQPDLVVVHNERNLGAPRARNRGLALARGRWLVVMDNDVIVTPRWLSRLLYHAAADRRSGCIGPLSNRAAHGQELAFSGVGDGDSLRHFADALFAANERQASPHNILTSMCLLFRREVLEAIGGFDERFSPWGYEDDDFTLRATLAGFRNRIARDVFVYHEHTGGEKQQRQSELLLANWRHFASKWGGDPDLPRDDNAALEARLRARPRLPALYVPLPKAPLVVDSVTA